MHLIFSGQFNLRNGLRTISRAIASGEVESAVALRKVLVVDSRFEIEQLVFENGAFWHRLLPKIFDRKGQQKAVLNDDLALAFL